ncbi:MAG: glycerol-3-phosphate acyltransferase [candidate division KSB1 bacterium]|nr:glycerol-3-phosphate acyltransferase [candidate division KSB1 bacterium]
MAWVKAGLAIAIGYLVGSFSTAYWVGRWRAGIDIREHGDGNAGTVNISKVLGLRAGIIVAIVDLSKGLLAYGIARWMGLGSGVAYGAGFAAILGHVAPFYLGFRGGQGAATATGLLLYSLAQCLAHGWLPPGDLAFFAWVVGVFAWISRKGEVIGCTILPLLCAQFLLRMPGNATTRAGGLLTLFLLAVNLFNLLHRKVLRLREEVRRGIKWVRFGLRPAAMAFPAAEQWLGTRAGVGLVGLVTLTAIAGDALRLARQHVVPVQWARLSSVLKEKEAHRFSSISLFLLASAITMVVFPLPIAWLALAYLVFGDMFGKFFGLQYGRHPFFHKTVEGTLACLAGCSVLAYWIAPAVGVPFGVALAGALAASAAESLPLGVDDNLSMALVSGATMYGLWYL